LARIFAATKYWRPEIQKLTLRLGEHTLRFTIDAPIVLVDETGRNLIEPARLIQGVVYAPESIVRQIFEWGLFADATWDDATRTIRFRSPVHVVRQAQLFPRGRVTEISATLLRGLPPRVLYATPSEIRILFEGGTLDTVRSFEGGIVTGGSIREVAGGVELRLRLGADAKGYAVSVGSGRLKVSVTDDKDLVDAGLFNKLEPVPIGGPDRDVRTIVIDPGHGGTDLGATLRGGMSEKDAALDLARALRSALNQRLSARVIMTRESDVVVSAARRAEIANEAGADLFISIHLDSEGSIKGGGFRVFTLSPGGTGGEGESDAIPEDIDGVTLRPWLGAQTSAVGSSMALAQAIADSLQHSFPGTPVLTRQGPMRILEPVVCPAIMLESAPAARTGPDATSRGYTIYDYARIVAEAIEKFVKAARG
ncbi:MAG TPA: N-acetylmuramoyl-L-alanine amidase, partial [Candidatus Dormibacteraeota bacterium]|nr:N-acetylmuramoyl-L-alanine amidase [Candidatus Dormibacteraeota bacterium]